MKHLGTKRIETDRLILRPFTLEDEKAMFQNWAGDDEVTKYLTWPTHENVAVSEAVLGAWVKDYEKADNYQWCIELKEKHEAIGSIAAVHLDEKIEEAEIGYCIGREFWHTGIMTEAFRAVISFFFEEVGVNRIAARHDVKNPHSGMVMEKCGLKHEGTIIQGDWNNTGLCDAALYGMVKRDYHRKEDAVETAAKKTVVHQKNVISDETIEYVGILAKLELGEKEKEQAKKEMGAMLDYIDKLNELDTTGVEPMSHVFPVNNVFREDVVTKEDGSEKTLFNAPSKKDGGFKVPKTIG